MADEKDPESPATTSLAYDAMLPRWSKMDHLLAGTEAMRAAGEKFLPRHQEETDVSYRNRVGEAVLLNKTAETLDDLSSKPFSEEVKLGDDVPEQIIAEVWDNVDLQGNNGDVFLRQWFRQGLAKAFCHVLVDFPRLAPPAEGAVRTLADDRQQGVRPYWVLVKPENCIFFHAEVVNGVETPVHVRILECFTEQQGFAQVEKKRIRVLLPGMVQVWLLREKKKVTDKDEWYKSDEWETPLDFIPIHTFYADREELCFGKSPLLDLADLNITHWQSTSEQRHILSVARFPILACSGASAEDSDPITVGPNRVLYNDDPQGKFYYVEHTGAAIEQGWKDLEALERQMGDYGSEFLKDDTGDTTATAKAIDSAESSSELACFVMKFQDAVAQVMDSTAVWMKIAGGKGGTVELVKDFGPAVSDAPGMDALAKARGTKDISRETYLEGLRLRGILPEDFDFEENAQQLLDEVDTLMSLGGTQMDIDPLTGNPILAPKKDDPPVGNGGKKPPAPKKAASKKSPK